MDGVHPRHFKLISPEGRRVCSAIFTAMELVARLPMQASWLTMCLIPKGPGKAGYRPIVLFAGIWRLYSTSPS